MSLSQPRTKTIKRLFALSRNECAFNGCTQSLVDEQGTVTGEICHIKAQSPEGPRYDSNQTDEERHGFDNLILMCSIHHKLIDDRPQEFTIDALMKLKSEYEFGDTVEEASDDVVNSLLVNSGFIGNISQTAGDGGINIAATESTVIVQSGLTYSDAKEIALDVYRANALELRGIAERVANERAEELTTAFFEQLRADSPNPPETLADPDMCHVLFEAQRHAARNGDKDLGSILVDLLVHRAKNSQRDLLQLVLDEAVTTAGKLTMPQFDALTIIFLLKYTRNFGVRNLETLAEYLTTHISPFLSSAPTTHASFQHLEYAGCGTNSIGSRKVKDIIIKTYGHIFITSVNRVELEQSLQFQPIQTETIQKSNYFTINNDDTITIKPLYDNESEKVFSQLGLHNSFHKRLREFISQKANQIDSVQLLKQVFPDTDHLVEWWEKTPSHFQLTSVGIAIAHANLRRKGLEDFDLRIWIN